MLDVDALDGADTIGEVENLWLAEGLGGDQPRSASQTTGGLRHSSMVVRMENDGANS